MDSWREVAAAVAQRQNIEPVHPKQETFGLPDALAAHLRALEYLPAPNKINRAENWRAVVADALIIARDGWAAKAIALGWTTSDLFGVGPRDDWEYSGLAVWLCGRPIVLMDECHAMVTDGDQPTSFRRGGMGHGTHPTITPVMLWDFGR